MIRIVTSIILMLLLGACSGDKPKLYERMTKIDAHVHIRTSDPAVMEFAASEGFKLITICTRSDSQALIQQQKGFAREMAGQFPEGIAYITTFSMEGFEEPGWAERVISGLQRDFDRGAIGVKVWKDIGMTFRDSLGNFIFLDDPRFEPVLDFIESSHKPMVAHIGEPRNCWLPLDSMTVNNDRTYFREHPQYHMYLHPDYPSHERLMESRDHVLAGHPDLKLIGAHLGSLEWDVDVLAERLDRYPNFAVDMAARVCHFQVQERQKVRDFILQYQDRLLYGTDLSISEENRFEDHRKGIAEGWRADWAYFATDQEMTSSNVEGTFRGLDLPESVLGKIFYTNALQWYTPGF